MERHIQSRGLHRDSQHACYLIYPLPSLLPTPHTYLHVLLALQAALLSHLAIGHSVDTVAASDPSMHLQTSVNLQTPQ